MTSAEFEAQLDVAMRCTDGIIVPKGRLDAAYHESLRENIRSSLCEPFRVTAIVEGDDFVDLRPGQGITAFVGAHAGGSWLAFQPDAKKWYCFWGRDRTHLGAHREAGNPLFVW